MSILTNEKYKGDALLQKTFTTDYLTKKLKVNEGEVPQYYVTGSHPAIIDPREWDMVQLEMEKRDQENSHSSSIFAGKILCGDCGCAFGSKVWHSNDKYRRVIWRCNGKYTGDDQCQTPALSEDQIKDWFSQALEKYLQDRDVIIGNLQFVKDSCLDLENLQKQMEDIECDMESTATAIRQCITENAAAAITQEEYRSPYNKLHGRYDELEQKQAKLNEKISEMKIEIASIDETISALQKMEKVPIAFDPMLWRTIVDSVVVERDGTVTFSVVEGQEYKFTVY